ncbi:MAG: aspartate aminotransferase family protein [Acidobacteria bacterium]|nr:aspartate aminotransferase family protein [Acidobacteriota bacterium]
MASDATLTETFIARNPESFRRWEDACSALPLGVSSTYQFMDPHPIFIERAQGSRLFDVDGHESIDFAMSHGSMLVGHAHPLIVRAVQEQVSRGTIYCHPTDIAVEVAREIQRRYPIDGLVRFTNSGAESTMHALRVARAYTGRDKIIKFEGNYHGAHDAVLVSIWPRRGYLGRDDRPRSLPVSDGIPSAVIENTCMAAFNNLESVEYQFDHHLNEIGVVIIEPVVMNAGIVVPEPGFLEGLRDLCNRNGTLLIFDEVKTGMKIAPGGAVQRYGVKPDMVCLSKAMGGGMPIGAFIGRREVMETISRGEATHVGTYNGNPICLATARAALLEVLTDETYARMEKLQKRLCEGCDRIARDSGLEAHALRVGPVGALQMRAELVRSYRDWMTLCPDLLQNYYLGMHNQGILVTQEQWIVSAQHSDEDIDRHLEAFRILAPSLAAFQSGSPR